MGVGSKGWAEQRYIREGRDVQEASNKERHSESVLAVEYRRTDEAPIVTTLEVQRFECLSRCYSSAYSRNVGGSTLRVPVEVLLQCLQSQRRRFYASSACRGAITVPTVATSEVLRFECLSRCYSSAYSRNVGGSTLQVPVEVQLQCLQSQRRRFYASSACRGAIPRRLSSQGRRFYAPGWKCHIRRDFKDTATSRRPPPPLRQNQNEDQTSPQRQERTVS